jgi:hypothetical protein
MTEKEQDYWDSVSILWTSIGMMMKASNEDVAIQKIVATGEVKYFIRTGEEPYKECFIRTGEEPYKECTCRHSWDDCPAHRR